MIVVSNTSPLTSLGAIVKLDLLRRVFGQIEISNAVWDELNAYGAQWPGRDEVAAASWIRRHPATADATVLALMRTIDRREAESISLSVKLGASLILLDDRDARGAAKDLGLRVAGVLGVLIQAKRIGELVSVRASIDDLRSRAGFFVSAAVYDHALTFAGET